MKWVLLSFGLGMAWTLVCAARAVCFSGRSAIGLSCRESSAGITSANLKGNPFDAEVGESLAAPIRRRKSAGDRRAGFSFGPNRNRRRHDWLPLLFASGQIRRVA